MPYATTTTSDNFVDHPIGKDGKTGKFFNRLCLEGTEMVIHSVSDPYSTECSPCKPGTYQDRAHETKQGLVCTPHKSCIGMDNMIMAFPGNATKDAICKCDVSNGYCSAAVLPSADDQYCEMCPENLQTPKPSVADSTSPTYQDDNSTFSFEPTEAAKSTQNVVILAVIVSIVVTAILVLLLVLIVKKKKKKKKKKNAWRNMKALAAAGQLNGTLFQPMLPEQPLGPSLDEAGALNEIGATRGEVEGECSAAATAAVVDERQPTVVGTRADPEIPRDFTEAKVAVSAATEPKVVNSDYVDDCIDSGVGNGLDRKYSYGDNSLSSGGRTPPNLSLKSNGGLKENASLTDASPKQKYKAEDPEIPRDFTEANVAVSDSTVPKVAAMDVTVPKVVNSDYVDDRIDPGVGNGFDRKYSYEDNSLSFDLSLTSNGGLKENASLADTSPKQKYKAEGSKMVKTGTSNNLAQHVATETFLYSSASAVTNASNPDQSSNTRPTEQAPETHGPLEVHDDISSAHDRGSAVPSTNLHSAYGELRPTL